MLTVYLDYLAFFIYSFFYGSILYTKNADTMSLNNIEKLTFGLTDTVLVWNIFIQNIKNAYILRAELNLNHHFIKMKETLVW